MPANLTFILVIRNYKVCNRREYLAKRPNLFSPADRGTSGKFNRSQSRIPRAGDVRAGTQIDIQGTGYSDIGGAAVAYRELGICYAKFLFNSKLNDLLRLFRKIN